MRDARELRGESFYGGHAGVVEALEPRRLMSVAVHLFTQPTGGSQPRAIVSGPDKNLWFVDTFGQKIGRVTTGGQFTLYPIAGGNAQDIARGADGNLWFTEPFGKKIGRITTGGTASYFTMANATFFEPQQITRGPDGNVWFTEFFGHVGKVTPAGAITEYALPSGVSGANDLVTGPDGAVWFTSNGKIGRVTTSGQFKTFNLPTGANPTDITRGPDGNLWFTDGGKIGKITPAGVATEYKIPSSNVTAAGIFAGVDGALWFTESFGDRLGRITTAGAITEQYLSLAANPVGITSGPDGNIWFTEGVQNKIGQAVIAGVVTGRVFNDANGDHLQDNGEAGLAGVKVYLDLDHNGILDGGDLVALTDAAGNFKFTGLAPNTYVLRQVVPTGYAATTPSATGGYSFTVAAGQTVSRLFGDRKIA